MGIGNVECQNVDKSKRWIIKLSKYLKFETVTKSTNQKLDRSKGEKIAGSTNEKNNFIQKIQASKDRYEIARCAYISTGQSEGVGGAMGGNYTLCRREHGKKKEEKTQKTDGLIT